MSSVVEKIQKRRKNQPTRQERIRRDVMKEDFLLKQIDEFKEKAQQLQKILDSKESRVQELQGIVEEQEQKSRSLDEILQEKQHEAESLTRGVEVYANKMAASLQEQLDRLQDQLSNRQLGNDEQQEQIVDSLSGISGTVGDLMSAIHGVPASVEGISSSVEGVSASVKNVSESMQGISSSMNSVSERLDTMKSELSEKVHTENVKSYRNMQSLIEELDKKLENVELGENSMKTMKSLLRAAIILGAVNLAGLIGVLLCEFGVFYFM